MLPSHVTPRRRAIAGGALVTAALLVAGLAGPAQADDPAPVQVVDGLIDTTDLISLGLPQAANAETVTIFEPGDADDKFNHGTVLLPFRGRLYAQWQSSALDEDAPETVVKYSVSDDGSTWSAPAALTAPRTDGYTSNGGWWTDGETLVAYLNVWPAALQPRGGYTEYVTSTDGENWSAPQRVTDANGEPVDGIIEQDVKALPSGRVLTAFHVQPGLQVKPYYTDDPLGITGWTQGEFDNQPYLADEMSRELEPSWHVRDDGSIVMTFRDQGGSSMFKLASVSEDDGETWSDSVVTNVPDSRTKQSAGNLPDGTAYMVGSLTGTKTRYPLVIVLSADGQTFDDGYALRDADDLQPRRYEGKSKNLGYSYQKSVVWGDYLYVSYGTNKEDVEFTRVPVADLAQRDVPGAVLKPSAVGAGRSLHVTWAAPADQGDAALTGYIVEAVATSGRTIRTEVSAGETSATLTGVHPGRYRVTVTAVNGFGAGEQSPPSGWTNVNGSRG